MILKVKLWEFLTESAGCCSTGSRHTCQREPVRNAGEALGRIFV